MSMRRMLKYLIMPLLMLVSCVNTDFDPSQFTPSLKARYLRASRDQFECSSSSATQFVFEVISLDTPWRFTDIVSWTSIDITEGDQSTGIFMDVTLSSANSSG